jgi:hypothetical protein
VTFKPPFRIALRIALPVALSVLLLVAGAPAASAGKPSSCTPSTPGFWIDNTFGWGMYGSWGMPGQQLKYALHLMNYDSRCGSSTFTVSLASPAGFSVSPQTTSISLRSATDAYIYVYVTSPSAIADGPYALTATAERTTGPSASATTYYKVYSADTTAPTLYYLNPADGVTVSGNSYHAAATSSDDHEVKQIEFYVDGVYKGMSACDDITYECQLSYAWSLSGVAPGQHVATFKSYDWMGNVGTRSTTFTVG